MKKYKSAYPALKRKLKDPFSAVHLRWVKKAKDFHHGDAKSKLHASIVNAHMGESVESKANSEWIEKQNIKEPVKKQEKKMAEQKDRIGKKTPSAEEIAKKHGISLAAVHAQIAKGHKVEREHTNSDAEAKEIARDHLDEFPDYYDRLHKMEKEAKKDMKEERIDEIGPFNISKHPLGAKALKVVDKVLDKVQDHADKRYQKKQDKIAKDRYGKSWTEAGMKAPRKIDPMHQRYPNSVKESILEATYHARVIAHPAVADVDHGGPGDYFVNLKKGWHLGDGSRSFGNESPKHAWKMLKHATQKDYKKWVSEDVANSVGGGNIAGMPTADTPDTSVPRGIGMVRRKKFAGKQVFVVDPDTFHKAYLGKRKYEHYEKYLEGCDIAEEIREFGRTNWAEPIIIENEQTGAMVYLKYGSK